VIANFRLPIAVIADFRLPIADCSEPMAAVLQVEIGNRAIENRQLAIGNRQYFT
jgi:hypothetical protein